MNRSTQEQWDAIVVGAGPAGSATALLLARAGYHVLLLDRARFPRDKPCSEYLTPGTTRVLERLGGGIVERLERVSHAKLLGMKVISPSGVEAVGRFPDYSFALPRTTFDLILRDAAAAAGAEVHEGVKVEDLVWDDGAVAGVVVRSSAALPAACQLATTRNPQGLPDGRAQRATLHARVVVGADGLRSVVARRLGVRRRSFPSRVAFAAHYEGVTDVGDLGEMHTSERGYVGLGPIGGGLTTIAVVLPRRAVRAQGPVAFTEELERFPGLRGRFGTARLVRPVLATGPFSQWSRRVTTDGACLVGDAADFFDPFTGQGIYAALRGAELAAETLRAALSRPGPVRRVALASYERVRRAEFRYKWLLERLIGVGVGWPALAERVVTRLARRPDLADLVVGATGNFIPARAALAPPVLAALLW